MRAAHGLLRGLAAGWHGRHELLEDLAGAARVLLDHRMVEVFGMLALASQAAHSKTILLVG